MIKEIYIFSAKKLLKDLIKCRNWIFIYIFDFSKDMKKISIFMYG